MTRSRFSKRSLAIVGSLWLLTITPVLDAGEPPEITVEVLDVNPGPVGVEPSEPVVWNGQLFFSADDSDVPGVGIGRELYTAGIATGPILVKDINTRPGDGGVPTLFHRSAAGLTDALIFTARPHLPGSTGPDDTGSELWRTQGTEPTTGIVKDINFLEASSGPEHMTTVFGGSHVAFSAFTGFYGREPWITDGTEEGTHNVGNIAPGGDDSDPYKFTAVNATQFVFLADDDSEIDVELYVSNGFTSTLLKDINPEPNDSSDPEFLTTFVGRNKVVFFAFDEIAGQEPWVTDGTLAGTFRLADINSGPASSNNDNEGDNDGFVQVGDLMYFSADDGTTGRELWVTDGTTVGTQMVTEIVPGSGGGYFAQAAAFQGLLYFVAQGPSLWRSDGTPGGTTEVVGAIFPAGMRQLTAADDLLFFAAGTELWVSDGTAGGTVSVQDFNNFPGTLVEITAFGTSSVAFRADTDAAGTEMSIAYPTSLGPDLEGPIVLPITPPSEPLGTFEDWFFVATAHELDTGGANVIDIEFQLDGAGDWIHLEPFDDGYDSPAETGIDSVRFANVGIHQLCVRGTDEHLNIGDPTCVDVPVAISDLTPPVPPQVSLSDNPVMVDEPTTLSVVATDIGTGDRDIILIEYEVDGGNWQPILTPLDGFYDEPTEEAEAELNFETDGMKNICARATDDAFNTGSPACVGLQVDAPPPTIRLRAIEVNQAIQNWRNEIPLYQGKATVVRVFLEEVDASSPISVRGQLHGSIGGNPFPDSPLPPDSQLFSFVADDAAAFTVVDERTVDSWRAGLRNSVNFTLPATWIDRGGSVDLEFELTSPLNQVLGCAEPDGSPDCIVSVSFDAPSRPVVQFFSVPYDGAEVNELEIMATSGTFRFTEGGSESDPVRFDANADDIEAAVEDVLNADKARVRVGSLSSSAPGAKVRITMYRGRDEVLDVNPAGLNGGAANLNETQKGGLTIAPTITANGDIREQIRRLSDNFPTNSVDFVIRELNGFNRTPRAGTVNRRLKRIHAVEFRFASQLSKFFGYLLGGPVEDGRGGMAWFSVSNTFANGTESPQSTGNGRNTGVHEGSHTYGRGHAVVEIRFVGPNPIEKIGICGSKYNLAGVLHPYVEEIPGLTNTGAEDRPRWEFTWPTIGPLSQGPDAEIWGFSPRAYLNGYDALTIIDPRLVPAMMSYCNSPAAGQESWVSSFSYQRLRDGLLAPRPGPLPKGAAAGEFLVVSGTIDEGTSAVTFDQPLRVTGDNPGNEPGSVHVALLDGLDLEIAAADVLLLGDGDLPGEGYGPGEVVPSFVAVLPVPMGSDPASITVSIDAVELGRTTGSANPPSVDQVEVDTVTAPAGTFEATWVADDLDGDPLTTTVLLSTDLGNTWKVLGLEVPGSSYAAPTTTLPASGSALIRVLVSDGFHQAEADSDPFVLDAGYPLAAIERPHPGIAAVPPGGVLQLRGDAWDPEDGLLEGFELLWTTDDGGTAPRFVGFGGEVDVPASQLTTGCQLITLTATDSDGRVGTDSVEVDIGATGCLGLFFADGFESGDSTAWTSAVP